MSTQHICKKKWAEFSQAIIKFLSGKWVGILGLVCIMVIAFLSLYGINIHIVNKAAKCFGKPTVIISRTGLTIVLGVKYGFVGVGCIPA